MSPTLTSAPPRVRSGALSYLSLFTSIGTLLCCALPSLLVLFGLGATVASVLSEVPWLVTMSHHKHWVFVVAGIMISGSFIYTYALRHDFKGEAALAIRTILRRVRRRLVSLGLCFGHLRCCMSWVALPRSYSGRFSFTSIPK